MLSRIVDIGFGWTITGMQLPARRSRIVSVASYGLIMSTLVKKVVLHNAKATRGKPMFEVG